MKERVIGSGNGPSQACLPGSLGLTIRQVAGLLKQIVGERHSATFPERLPGLGLLGFASKIEIGLKPKLVSFDLAENLLDTALCGIAEPSWGRGGISNYDSKEEGDVSLPVLGKAIHYTDHVRFECALRSQDACPNLALIDPTRNNRHNPLSLGD